MASTQTIEIMLIPADTVAGVPIIHEQLIYKTVNDDDPDNIVTSYEVASANSSTYGTPDAPNGQAAISAVVKGASGLANDFGALHFVAKTMDKIQYGRLLKDTPGVKTITVATGSDLSAQWDKIKEAGSQINDLNAPYSLLTTNCFSAVSTELTAAGITVPTPEIRASVGDLYMLGIEHVLPVAAVPSDAVSNNIQVNTIQNNLGDDVLVITHESGNSRQVASINEKTGAVALTQSTTADTITTTTIDANADSITDTIRTVTTNADGTQTITVDQGANGTIDSRSTATTLAKGVQLAQDDKNNDAVVDGISIITTLNNGQQFTQDVSDARNVQKQDANMAAWFKSGKLDQASYQTYSVWSTAPLVDASVTLAAPAWNPIPGTTYDGKKAFYETTTTPDTSPSIATSTGVLLDAKQHGVTAAQLAALDLDKNSKLASTELTGLQIWRDLNEDGLLDAGELTALSDAGITQLNSADYPFYTQGNGLLEHPSDAAPSDTTLIPPVPDSNYRTLRDSDNRYYASKTQWIDFTADQIKINDTKRNTLIGTNKDDNFDANYYKEDFVDNTLLRNFLAGPGNDVMGGSTQSDTLWGDTGNDLLFGYAGDDHLYGEAGNDELQGGLGNDVLVSGTGQDKVFGGVGNDTLAGGEEDDVLMGFNPINDPEQTLSKGQTDDDVIDGGAGKDLLLGALGNDVLFGGLDNDDVSGDAGNDRLYGGEGADRLFGGVGNDALYGGQGDDLLYGFTPTNDPKQTLNAGETDNDWLYGGAGTDTLIAGLGNDYLDGGAGADKMHGGLGDDTYIVNSVNDVIIEQVGEGMDTVISGANYMLNANIEELRLLEGGAFNGTGNNLDNRIIGNRSDNLLDGVTGADTMLGGLGNDTYVVDNTGDRITELAGEGIDTVQSKISYTLADNLENLSLLDFSNPEPGSVDGVSVLVYGQPRANALDYTQGDGVATYKGTCGLTAIANIAAQAGMSITEGQAVQKAIDNQWCVTDATKTDDDRGTSNYLNQQALMSSYGINNQVIQGYNELAIANLIKVGRGVIMGVNAGKLWGGNTNANYDFGVVDHVITITGAVYDASSGVLAGFYIADSGRGKVDDQARYMTAADLKVAAGVGLGYTIYTTDPIKLWDENTNAMGNSLDNTLTGNRGNNILNGLAGNDILIGGAGNDTYRFGLGAGVDTIVEADAADSADTIAIGAGVNQEQLWFSQSGNDLVMSIIGTGDQSIIKDWYVGSEHQVEQIYTADGHTLVCANVQNLVQAMSSFTPPAMGTTVLSDAQKTTLAPVIAVSWA